MTTPASSPTSSPPCHPSTPQCRPTNRKRRSPRRYFDRRDRRWKLDRCNYECTPWHCECNNRVLLRSDSTGLMSPPFVATRDVDVPLGADLLRSSAVSPSSCTSSWAEKERENAATAGDRSGLEDWGSLSSLESEPFALRGSAFWPKKVSSDSRMTLSALSSCSKQSRSAARATPLSQEAGAEFLPRKQSGQFPLPSRLDFD